MSLDDAIAGLESFTSIMDSCGPIYGRRYRAVLESLRSVVNDNDDDVFLVTYNPITGRLEP